MPNLTLYEIGAEMEAFEAFLEECGGDVSNPDFEKMIDDWLISNEKLLSDKLDNYGMLIKNRQMFAEKRREEAKRLNELAGTDETFIEQMKKRLKDFFNEKKIKKMESTKFKWWVQNNGQRSMTVSDTFEGEEGAKKLPERYQKVVTLPDAAKMREDLKEIEALIAKQELALESRGAQEFTDEDRARLDELNEYTNGVAWFEPIGNHLRMK